MAGVSVDEARAVGRRAPHGRHRAGAADGVGDPRRGPPAARPRPRGDRGRARAAAGDGAPLRRRRHARPDGAGDRRRVLERHVRPHARRRPRTPPRRRRPPPPPAPRRRRAVHDRRGGAAGRVRACCHRSRPCAAWPGSTSTRDVAARIADGRGAPGAARATGRGRWSARTSGCSPCTSPSAEAGPSRPSCWCPGSVGARGGDHRARRAALAGPADRGHDRRLRRRAPRSPGGDRGGQAPGRTRRGRCRSCSRSTATRPRSCGRSRRRSC